MESDAASFYPVTFSVSKKPSIRQRLHDTKPVVLFVVAVFAISFIIPPILILLGSPFWSLMGGHHGFLSPLFVILVGALSGLSIMFAVRFFSRTMLGGNQKKIKELEARLKAGSSDVVVDLDSLITEHLRRGRPQIAEYYSKQLMSLCENAHNKDVVIPDLMVSTKAFVSRPEYHKSLNYFAVWMFQSNGLLCLTKDHLEYESSRISFRVALSDIVDIGVDHHPRWLKPYPLRFIKLTFAEREYGTVDTFYLTPYVVQTDTVWDINKSVAEWYNELTKALQKV
mgnify:CR=1 FL=1